jgi:hypothetical protein
MMKFSYPESPLAYTEPLEEFPPRSFPRILMSDKTYRNFIKRYPFQGYSWPMRGYGWHGSVDRARGGRGRLKITIQ